MSNESFDHKIENFLAESRKQVRNAEKLLQTSREKFDRMGIPDREQMLKELSPQQRQQFEKEIAAFKRELAEENRLIRKQSRQALLKPQSKKYKTLRNYI